MSVGYHSYCLLCILKNENIWHIFSWASLYVRSVNEEKQSYSFDTLISFSSSLSSIGHQKIRSDVYSFRSKKIFFFRYGMLLALPGTYHHWCASKRVNRVAFNVWKTFFFVLLITRRRSNWLIFLLFSLFRRKSFANSSERRREKLHSIFIKFISIEIRIPWVYWRRRRKKRTQQASLDF